MRRESETGLPLSRDSSAASSSISASIRSQSRRMSRPRWRASIRDQGPVSNASRAACTAASTSAASPSATWAITSSVAGSIVANVLPLWAGRHSPPIKSCVWRICGRTGGWDGATTAMQEPPQSACVRNVFGALERLQQERSISHKIPGMPPICSSDRSRCKIIPARSVRHRSVRCRSSLTDGFRRVRSPHEPASRMPRGVQTGLNLTQAYSRSSHQCVQHGFRRRR